MERLKFLFMESGGNGEEDMMVVRRKDLIMAEVKKQLCLALPLLSVNLLLFSLQVISVMFVGHLGELALSGASMATSFAGVTGFSLLFGMACALDTFCGQAFGAKQYHLLGVYTRRAMLHLTLVSIPLALTWAYTGQILMALRQNQEISLEAGVYARWMIPAVFAYGLVQCQIKFLQTQNIVFPMMISCGVTALLHLSLCWILVFKCGLRGRGAALANSISYWVNVAPLTIYVKFSPSCKGTWLGFSKEALQGIPNFFKLALPSALMVCLEFWSFEMLVLLSGLLPDPKLETSLLSISLNTSAMRYMIISTLGSVISIRVSNELGAGQPAAARLAICITMSVGAIEGVLAASCVISVRHVWGKLYSNEDTVVKHLATMMPLIAISTSLDGLQCALSGTARGCGKQKIGAFVNLGSYYIVGLPSGILFGFIFHFKGKGLWLGIICALSIQILLLSIMTVCIDWEKEAKKAKDRVSSPTFPIDTTPRESLTG